VSANRILKAVLEIARGGSGSGPGGRPLPRSASATTAATGNLWCLAAGSFLMMRPPFITNLTRCSTVMSAMGSPCTAIKSANFPTSTAPTSSGQPIRSAAEVVAARIASKLVRPASHRPRVPQHFLPALDRGRGRPVGDLDPELLCDCNCLMH